MTHSPMFLQPVTRAELPAFHTVMLAAGMDARSSWSRTTLQDLEKSLLAEGSGGFLAVMDGEVVGCVSYRPDGAETLTLNKLATLPQVRGQGYGQKLVQAVEELAQCQGFGRVLLAVSQYNLEVVPFYQKLGYTQTEEAYAFANPNSPKPVVLTKDVPSLQSRIDGIRQKLDKLRFLDGDLKVFGSEKHKYKTGTITEQEAANLLGQGLPPDYVLLLQEVGSGAGPYYGLYPIWQSLEEKVEVWLTYQELEVDEVAAEEYTQTLIENGARKNECIPICDCGCGERIQLVIAGHDKGYVWFDYGFGDHSICPLGLSVLDFYEGWLNESLQQIGIAK